MSHEKLAVVLLAAAASLFCVAGARGDALDYDGLVVDVTSAETMAGEAIPPDVYIAVEKQRQIRSGSTFKVFRPESVREEPAEKHPLKLYVGRLQVIDLQGEIVIGRMIEFAPRSEHPRVRYETVMVGDRIRAIILKVDKAQRGPQVVLSRATPMSRRQIQLAALAHSR